MSRQSWVETINVATSSGAAIATTAAETIVFPDFTMPAYYLQDGRTLRVKAFGQYSNTGTPTLTFRMRWGGVAGTILCQSAACTTPSAVTAAAWELEVIMQSRLNGASGLVMANGCLSVYANVAGTVASATGEALVTPMTAGGVTTPATATIDMTAATALSITAQWSASSASNTLTGLNYVVEALN